MAPTTRRTAPVPRLTLEDLSPELLMLICEHSSALDVARWALTGSDWAARLAPFVFHVHEMVNRAERDFKAAASFDALVALYNSTNFRWITWDRLGHIGSDKEDHSLNLINSCRTKAGFIEKRFPKAYASNEHDRLKYAKSRFALGMLRISTL